jgi:ubiquitin-protein ligase
MMNGGDSLRVVFMNSPTRHQRLADELAALVKLRESSSVLEFQTSGEPTERYTITLRGKSPCRASSARGGVEICQLQRCEVRLPFTYPEQAPDVRWLTPIVHPNISFSGFLSWREIGIEWSADVTLAVVCERLWDVARLAYVNRDAVLNYSAERWLDEQDQGSLPLDPRPLRDLAPPANLNVVRYTRRDGRRLVLPVAAAPTEVLFIGEDTPAPPPRSARGPDDIFYIGDE